MYKNTIYHINSFTPILKDCNSFDALKYCNILQWYTWRTRKAIEPIGPICHINSFTPFFNDYNSIDAIKDCNILHWYKTWSVHLKRSSQVVLSLFWFVYVSWYIPFNHHNARRLRTAGEVIIRILILHQKGDEWFYCLTFFTGVITHLKCSVYHDAHISCQ